MNWSRPAVSAQVINFLEKIYLYYTYSNIDEVKIFCVLHDKIALLTRICSEQGTRNCHERIFRKALTIQENVIKRLTFYDAEADIRLSFYRSFSKF